MKRKKLLTVLILCATALTLVFIFGNSLLSREASSRLSDLASSLLGAHIVSSAEELAAADTWFTSHLIRKLAHMTEFAFLGAELTLICRRFFKKAPVPLVPLFSGLLLALADETVQIFSLRGPSVTDVWIDGAGVALGVAAAMLILSAVSAKRS